MKTRDRILHTSLQLFNEHGEPNVTTLQIADELDISPGNLYYHFKNKSEIIDELFASFESHINTLLDVPEDIAGIDDQWLFLHLVFEAIGQYRFIYQDLVNILSRYDKIQPRFKRVLNRKLSASRSVCQSLARQGILLANADELEALCQNIVLTITYWISFDKVKNVLNGQEMDVGRGVYQVLAQIAPFLREEERRQLQAMGEAYIG